MILQYITSPLLHKQGLTNNMVFVSLTFFLIYMPTVVFSQPTVIFDNANNSVDISKTVDILEDKNHELTLSEVLSMPDSSFNYPKDKGTNFGYSLHKYWLSFDIENKTNDRLFLLIDNPILHYLNIHIIDENEELRTIESGAYRRFDTRSLKTEAFTFDLGFRPKRVLVETNSLTEFFVPISVEGSASLVNKLHDDTLLRGLLLGIFGVLLIYNLFIFINVKEEDYFWYLLFVLTYFIITLRLRGLGFSLFWSDMPALNGADSYKTILHA